MAIVVYAGAAGVVLPPTAGDRQGDDRGGAGATAAPAARPTAAPGIELAYQVARESFIEGGINRVILATDGDFNVGTVESASLAAI